MTVTRSIHPVLSRRRNRLWWRCGSRLRLRDIHRSKLGRRGYNRARMQVSIPKLIGTTRTALRHVVDFCYPGKCSFCEAPCEGKGVRPLEAILRLGVFDDPIKHLIHQIKYHRGWPLAEFLADRLLDQERVTRLVAETAALVPAPPFPLRP